MTENELAKIIVNIAFQVHSKIGPGLLGSVYEEVLLTYLRVTGLKLGLLINFNEELIKNGITRIRNNLLNDVFAILN